MQLTFQMVARYRQSLKRERQKVGSVKCDKNQREIKCEGINLTALGIGARFMALPEWRLWY